MIFKVTNTDDYEQGTIDLDLIGEDEIGVTESDFLPQISSAIVRLHKDKILAALYADEETILRDWDLTLRMPPEFQFIQ